MDYCINVIDSKYSVIKSLGSGATCKVKLGIDINAQKLVAIKILKEGYSNLFSQEAEHLKLLNHPNIIYLLEESRGVWVNKRGECQMIDYIVLEYASNGNLFDYILFPKRGFPEKYACFLFLKLLDGLEACHNAGIAHRDLKPDNVMLTSDWIIKIADFGCSTKIDGDDKTGILNSYVGTQFYMAPEIRYRRSYSGVKVDIFSMGVILFALVTGRLPFVHAEINDLSYRYIFKNDIEAYWSMMDSVIDPVSEDFKNLITMMIAYDPSQRPSIQNIRNHPWIAMAMPSDEQMILEFEERKKAVNAGKKIKTLIKQEMKNKIQISNPQGTFKTGNSGLLFPLKNSDQIPRTCKKFIDTGNPYHLEFIGTNPEDILNLLSFFLEEEVTKNLGIVDKLGGNSNEYLPEVKVNEKHTCYSLLYKIPPEQAEEEREYLEMSINLTEVDDSEVYFLEFVKYQGNNWEFAKFFNNFQKFVESNF